MKTRLPVSAAATLFALVAVQPACAQNWMQTLAPYNWWTSVACSTNGTKLVAAGGGSVYTSTNSGLTWTVDGAFDGPVASSADGVKLVVATSGQGIRTSTNSGETWTLTSAPAAGWSGVASSADGTKLVACSDSVYVSADSGATWLLTAAHLFYGRTLLASSADGTKIVAADMSGPIYLSGDSGHYWWASSAPHSFWFAVASSADGTRLIAAANGKPVYISTDSGSTWKATGTPSPSSGWGAVASSGDGTKLAAATFDGYTGGIYLSTNSGATWRNTGAPSVPNLYWCGLAFSADGSKLAAVAYYDGIYVYGDGYSPMILNQPASITNIYGTTAAFSVTLFGSSPLQYQWRKNGLNLTNSAHVSGATNSTLTLTNVSHDDVAIYDVVVTNSAGSVTSSVVTLTVLEPLILSQPASQTNFAASDAAFSVSAAGTPPIACQWRKNGTNLTDGGNLSGAAAQNLVLHNILKADEGDYDVIITSAGGSITSSVAMLAVIEPVIATQPADQTQLIGTSASFNVTAFGTPPLFYQWRQNGVNLADGGRISGATTTNLILTGLAPRDEGNYSVVVSNAFGSVTSLDAVLRVQTWLPADAPDDKAWGAVAASASGIKMVAVVQYQFGEYENYVGAPIYTSTNWGVTWEQTSAPSNFWSAVASSADGLTLAAAASGDGIYVSTNSGATWTQTTAPIGNWSAIAASADGVKLVAAMNGDELYTSGDSGGTWATNAPAGKAWSAVASSADGMKLVATINGEGIYVSTDAGGTWTNTSAPVAAWSAVASSADGTKLASAISGDTIYVSTNSGATWTPASAPTRSWTAIASSADGRKLSATTMGEYIWTSTDSGATWFNTGSPAAYWSSVASSADGNRLAATTYGLIVTWPAQPILNITAAGTNLIISWPSYATNFVLRQNDDLTTTNWVNATVTVNDDGAYRRVNVNPTVSHRFYQLVRP